MRITILAAFLSFSYILTGCTTATCSTDAPGVCESNEDIRSDIADIFCQRMQTCNPYDYEHRFPAALRGNETCRTAVYYNQDFSGACNPTKLSACRTDVVHLTCNDPAALPSSCHCN